MNITDEQLDRIISEELEAYLQETEQIEEKKKKPCKKAKGKRYSVGSAPLSSTYLCCEDIGHKSTRVVAVRFFPCLVSTNSSLNLLFHRGKC